MDQSPRQPRTIGRVLDAGLQLYRACFKRVFSLSLIANLVVLAFTLTQIPAGSQSLTHMSSGPLHSALWWGVLAFAVKLVFKGAVIHALASTQLGLTSRTRDNLGAGVRRLPALFFAAVIYALAVALGTLALVVPGVWLGYSLVLFPVPVMVDKLGPLRGLEKSYDTVKGHWWRTATVLTVAGALVFALYFAASLLIGAATGLSQGDFHVIGNTRALTHSAGMLIAGTAFVNAVLNALLTPLGYAVAVVHYEDLRLRKSGADLESRINSALSD